MVTAPPLLPRGDVQCSSRFLLSWESDSDLFTGTVKLLHVMTKSIHSQSGSGHAILAVAAFRRRQEWQGASRHCVLSVLRISFVAIDSFCGPHKVDLIASSVDTEIPACRARHADCRLVNSTPPFFFFRASISPRTNGR